MKKFKVGDQVMVRERFRSAYYQTKILADVNYDGRAPNEYLVAGVDFGEKGSLPARTVHAYCIHAVPNLNN